MDAFVVLMQVGRDGDWTDRGLPEVVTGYDRADNIRDAALQWLLDHHPGASGDDWQLLVWDNVREQTYQHGRPTVIVKPMELQAAGAGIHARSSARRGAPRAGRVVEKVRAELIELGEQILVTQQHTNTTAYSCPGPWYPANTISADAVAVRVSGRSTMTWRGEEYLSLLTPVGELSKLSPKQPVIPIGDED